MVEVIGYAAFGLNVAGNLMLARMNVWGWIVRLVTNVAWITYAVQIPGGGPMWMNHIAFFAINIYGFRQWRGQPEALADLLARLSRNERSSVRAALENAYRRGQQGLDNG